FDMLSTVTTMNSNLMDSFYKSIGCSEVVKANGFLFLSGCVGFDSQKNLPSDFKEQSLNAFRQIKNVILEAGGKPENIVQLMTFSKFVGNENMMDDLSVVFAAKEEVIPGCRTAVSCFRVTDLALPEILIEAQAIVALG